MAKHSTDPLRSRLFDLISNIEDRLAQLRDFAATPGNAWLAKGELQQLTILMSDLESLLEDIKQADVESGY